MKDVTRFLIVISSLRELIFKSTDNTYAYTRKEETKKKDNKEQKQKRSTLFDKLFIENVLLMLSGRNNNFIHEFLINKIAYQRQAIKHQQR